MPKLFKSIHFYFNLLASWLVFAPYRTNRVPCVRLGNLGAFWWVPTESLKSKATVYSGGVGNDISFELALCTNYKMNVFTFDPTPAAISYIKSLKQPKSLHFQPVGLWNKNTRLKFYVPKNKGDVSHSVVNLQKTADYFLANCKTISSLMKKNSHTKIDLLKIDIEGAEYAVLNSIISNDIFPKVICVEFDQPASILNMLQMVQRLVKSGYIVVKQDFFNLTFLHL